MPGIDTSTSDAGEQHLHVTIVLVNLNTPDDTLACLESISLLEAGASLSLIVVDNGSEDNSVSTIGEYLSHVPQAVLIPLKTNRGYAAGCNAGVKSVLSSQPAVSERNEESRTDPDLSDSETSGERRNGPDYIWLLNNDTSLAPNALSTLLASAEAHPGIRIWGSTIRDMDPPHVLQCAGGFRYLPALSIPLPAKMDPLEFSGEMCVKDRRLDYISGVSMFVKADVFRERLLDESYFLYYEELELVRIAGGKSSIAWCPESVVFHKGGATTGGVDPNRGHGSDAAHYFGNTSALRYTWKYHRVYFPFVFVFRLVVKTVLFIWYGEWRGFRPMLRGYRDFFWAKAQ